MVTDGCFWGGITNTSDRMDIDTMDTSDTVDNDTVDNATDTVDSGNIVQ